MLPNKNKYTKNIPAYKGNRYVISDIHGCVRTFDALIKKIDLQLDDQLFLLGDYIDKGNNCKGTINYIIDLSEHFQVFPLKGNHEDDFEVMLDINSERLFQSYLEKQPNSFLNDDFSVDDKYLNFIKSLPYYFELENHFIVHAGFNFESENHLEDTEEMLWIRDFEYDKNKARNKTIIFGHTIYDLPYIKTCIENDKKIIPLDNGVFYTDEKELGNLLCLNIDTYELIIQKNIE